MSESFGSTSASIGNRVTRSRLYSSLSNLFEIDASASRIVPMEGLRGLAVLLVFFVHYVTLIEPWLAPGSWTAAVASTLRGIGHSGVDLFFVLSGYLIYGTLIERDRPLFPYLRRRIVRIYPTFLVMFVIYIGLSYAAPEQSKIPSESKAALIYLLQNFFLLPGLFPIEPMITVAWSLSYEFFYYLALPLIIALLGLRRWSRSQRSMLFALVACAIFSYCAVRGGHVRLSLFVSGILVYETVKSAKLIITDAAGFVALLAGLSSIALLSLLEAPPVLRFITLFVAFYLLCSASFSTSGLCARVFSWTPMRWLGNMSYSYYLMHGLVLKVFFTALPIVLAASANESYLFWLLLPVAIVATLVGSAFLFAFVEKPFSLNATPVRRPQPIAA